MMANHNPLQKLYLKVSLSVSNIGANGFITKENAQFLFLGSFTKSGILGAYTELPMSLKLHELTLIVVIKIKMSKDNTYLS